MSFSLRSWAEALAVLLLIPEWGRGAPSAQNAEAPPPMMMNGILGGYPMTREASGTSWVPDDSTHSGIHLMEGGWMLMGHTLLNGVYDWQQGPRGDSATFLSGMLMGMAGRHFEGGDALQFRAMVSPEPWMGKSGYPLLLATGESADGVSALFDRQHPHDLFMELSGTYSHALTVKDSVFIYTALPGEPAFGPPAFMHRESILDSPEAPISHHWLDSTHISYGVVTGGAVHDRWKVEVSRFRGREPDQFRYNIETGALDSSSARLSWNPAQEWAWQVSWAHQISPEQLEPAKNEKRFSASGIYTRQLGGQGVWSSTVAWGRRRSSGDEPLNAYALESSVRPNDAWSLFARIEQEKNNELIVRGLLKGTAYQVAKTSVGVIRDFRLSEHLKIGAGALYSVNFLPGNLTPLYGGTEPRGVMAFLRLKSD